MKKTTIFVFVLSLFILFIFISLYSYAQDASKDISDNFFRLHIIANSNSDEDQNLKLKIRDNVLEYINTLSLNNQTKDEIISSANENLQNIKSVVEKTIYDEGYEYSVNLEIGNFYFPTKEYGNLSLPAGYYDALKIEIGNANGKNWWCSLFPPLCFVDISSGIIDEESEEYLKENLSEDEFNIITNSSDSGSIKLKFKILELLNTEN